MHSNQWVHSGPVAYYKPTTYNLSAVYKGPSACADLSAHDSASIDDGLWSLVCGPSAHDGSLAHDVPLAINDTSAHDGLLAHDGPST